MKAAGIVYINDGQVLLLLHKPVGQYPACWGIPGGKVEPGETHIQAAIRESEEETGHTPAEPLMQISDVDEGGIHYVTYRCAESFTPVLSGEHLDYIWADMDNLPAPLHPAVARTLAGQVGLDATMGQILADSENGKTLEEMKASARKYDVNGFFEVARNPISKVGVYPYRGSSIGAPDPDKIYMVYRPAEELAHPDCLASFRLLPITDEHEMLGSMVDGLTPAEVKGMHGCLGEQITFEDPYVYSNLVIHSESMKQAIDAGKVELSCGYRCAYEAKQGVYNGQKYDYIQRNVRGNHLALVEQGRMGPDVRVLDHSLADHYFTVDAKEMHQMTPELKQALEQLNKLGTSMDGLVKTVTGLDSQVKVLADKAAKDAEEAAAKEAEAAAKGDKKDEAEPMGEGKEAKGDKKDEAEAEKAMDAKIAKAVAAAIKPVMDSLDEIKKGAPKAAMDAMVKRDELAEALVPHIGVFNHAGMGLDEVVKYGTDKLGLKPEAGAELATLQGYLHAKTAPAVALGMDAAPKAAVNTLLGQYN